MVASACRALVLASALHAAAAAAGAARLPRATAGPGADCEDKEAQGQATFMLRGEEVQLPFWRFGDYSPATQIAPLCKVGGDRAPWLAVFRLVEDPSTYRNIVLFSDSALVHGSSTKFSFSFRPAQGEVTVRRRSGTENTCTFDPALISAGRWLTWRHQCVASSCELFLDDASICAHKSDQQQPQSAGHNAPVSVRVGYDAANASAVQGLDLALVAWEAEDSETTLVRAQVTLAPTASPVLGAETAALSAVSTAAPSVAPSLAPSSSALEPPSGSTVVPTVPSEVFVPSPPLSGPPSFEPDEDESLESTPAVGIVVASCLLLGILAAIPAGRKRARRLREKAQMRRIGSSDYETHPGSFVGSQGSASSWPAKYKLRHVTPPSPRSSYGERDREMPTFTLSAPKNPTRRSRLVMHFPVFSFRPTSLDSRVDANEV